MKKSRQFSRTVIFALLPLFLFLSNCSKIDKEIDKAVDKFIEGVFVGPEGSELEFVPVTNDPDHVPHCRVELAKKGTGLLNSSSYYYGEGAYYSKNIGDAVETLSPLDENNSVYVGSFPIDDWSTTARGRLTYNTNSITFTPEGSLYVGQPYTMNRKGTSGGGNNNGGNNNGGNNSGTDTAYAQNIDGKKHEQKVVSVTLPSGLKSVTFKTVDQAGNYRNYADMYVRKGSEPKLTYNITQHGVANFSYQGDCGSDKANNESEVCVFQNPAAGTWYVTLFGYNQDFESRLLIITTK